MKSSSAPAFKKQRASAFIPFTILCLTVAFTYVTMRVEIMNRPALKPGTAKRASVASQLLGKPLPYFKLKKLDGETVTNDDYKGKFLFVNIWATWCPPCVDEMPSMENLHLSLEGADFEMLAISIDKGGEKVVRDFVEKYGLTFTILLDPKSRAAKSFKTTGVPETFLVSHEGIVIHHQVGPLQWDKPNIVKTIKALVTDHKSITGEPGL